MLKNFLNKNVERYIKTFIWFLIIMIGINILGNLFPSRFKSIDTKIKSQLNQAKCEMTDLIFFTAYPWTRYIEKSEKKPLLYNMSKEEKNLQFEKSDQITTDNKKIKNSEDIMGIWFAKFANWSLPLISFVDSEAGGSSATYADPSYFTYQMMMAMKQESNIQIKKGVDTVLESNAENIEATTQVGETVPSSENAAPLVGEAVPSGESVSQAGETVPSSEIVSQTGETVPSSANVSQAAVPSSENVSQAGETVSSSESVSQAGETVSSSENVSQVAVPSSESAAPQAGETVPSSENVSQVAVPSSENVSQAGEAVPSSESVSQAAISSGEMIPQTETSVQSIEETQLRVEPVTQSSEMTSQVMSTSIPYNPLIKTRNWALKIGFSMEELQRFDFLMDKIYIVSNGASITQNELNPTALLSKDVTIKGNRNLPQILIYHTHSQEAFADSTAKDVSQTVVGMGNILTDLLVSTYGYNVIHYQGSFDMKNDELDRESSYTRALPEISKIVTDNPSIELIIDLHRDGVDDNVHLVSNINGVSTAKIMLLDGLSRDSNGEIAALTNDYREENLSFSLQLYLAGKASYPDFLRSIYLKSSRYNQHLRRSILIEIGAQNNTVEEAKNAIAPLADILNQVLSR